MAIINRLSRRYPKAIFEGIIYTSCCWMKRNYLIVNYVEEFSKKFESFNCQLNEAPIRYSVEIHEDVERKIWLPRAKIMHHGAWDNVLINKELFLSSDYRHLSLLGEKLKGFIQEGAYVERGEKRLSISSFAEAVQWLMLEAKKGQTIQRYKGLGEMNPEQLWETTMNPDTRRMLQVTIEDAVAADQIFTTLMGDQVEPRREFIEANALEVVNLDI